MALDKERIYGYVKDYLKAQIALLKDKTGEAESDYRVGNACLLQLSLNLYEDDLRELEKIMEDQNNE